MTSSFRYAATTSHQIPCHGKCPTGHLPPRHKAKRTIKRQRSPHLPTTASKVYHHRKLTSTFGPPRKTITTFQSTLHSIAVYSSVIAWAIHQQTITAATATAATRAALFAPWAWTALGIPVLSCALGYSLTICYIIGTTSAMQIMRGCATEG